LQLRAEQLKRHLEEQVSPFYLLSGDEPFQLSEATDLVRAAARVAGCSERLVFTTDREFSWSDLTAEAGALSLFAERRLLELRMLSARPGKEGGATLAQMTTTGSEDVLLITAPRLDATAKRASWYKTLAQAGMVVEFWPIGATELPQWINARFTAAGVTASRDACQFLAGRTEGNLVAAAQSVALLALLAEGQEIGIDEVARAAGDSARYDSFMLVDAMLGGDLERSLRIVRGMRAEGAALPPLVGSVAWMLRAVSDIARRVHAGEAVSTIFSDRSLGVWRQRRPAVERAIRRHPVRRWLTFIADTNMIDQASKGMRRDDPWLLLEQLCVAIAHAPLLACSSGAFHV
jgi:DNA polymerase III subunit delta